MAAVARQACSRLEMMRYSHTDALHIPVLVARRIASNKAPCPVSDLLPAPE